MRDIHLDFNASTPVAPEVVEIMRHARKTGHGNPSSSHWAGIPARQMVEAARTRAADLLGWTRSITLWRACAACCLDGRRAASPGRERARPRSMFSPKPTPNGAAVNGAVFYPPLGLAAKAMAPMDPWIGRRTTVGAAFLGLSASKPLEKRNETEPT